MSINLLDSISGVFNNEMIRKAAGLFGESESSITKAVGAGIPSLLSGVLSSSSTDGGSNLLNLAKQAAGSGILDNVGDIFKGSGSNNILNAGSGLLSGLFGNKVGGLAGLISNFAGVKQITSNSILSAIAPVALGFIGKHALSNNLSGSGILSWLTGQKSQISKAIPEGLNLSGIFNGAGQKVSDTVHAAASYAQPKKAGSQWLTWLLLALAGIAMLWYFLRGCNDDVSTTAVIDSTVVVPPVVKEVAVAAEPARESLLVKLPDGSELNAFKGGIEDMLVGFLNNTDSKAGKDVWYDFDNLNFETGSAKITPESQVQVNNIAAILKAYPKLAIKVGGYTDVTGDAAANKKLSQDRAEAVVAALKTAGTNAGQLLGAEGYGSQFAKAAADATDEEKRKDRRIAVGVRRK